MWIEGILDKAMMIHHPLCLLGLFIPLYENISGMECMLAIFLSEISNPAMHIRQILRISGRRYTKAYEITEVTFISLYFYARFIAIGPVIYQTCACDLNHLFLKISCIGLVLQSWFFIMQMYKTLNRRYSEVLARKNHGIKLNWLDPLTSNEQTQLDLVYKQHAKGTNEAVGI